MTHEQIKAAVVAWLSALSPPLPVVSGPITITSAFAPAAELERDAGTTIEVFMQRTAISRVERKSVQRDRVVRILVRHRIDSESNTGQATEQAAFSALHNNLETRLVDYVAADRSHAALAVDTTVLLEGQMFYQEGVASCVIDLTVRNYE